MITYPCSSKGLLASFCFGSAIAIAAAEFAIAGFPPVLVIDGAVRRGVAPSFCGTLPCLLCAPYQQAEEKEGQNGRTH